mmetsp:Transcript_22890/g.33529  ORF Transcript_22890/g.33529 Transcript_22890/m.33529 type:complete len:262 (+) Transcript_22890:99-884(+)|eukprot:CAMPEP_0197244342 /NCGR_PEP_ID=MMETSP1429-20130617/9490_1 /TAXON_ID=49237 /ORGANISM="Chaetoceros  sp., Strain UNC1202" /LENGTH=261 /DNA_ID=CAMNT_0042704689 /DNA_START=93 /DNA_END=878 /DNA_ORIENTATION=-
MSGLDATSELFLSAISVLDSYGAKDWDLRVVTATSAALLLGMRMQIGHKYEIDWEAFVHAVITGVGSAMCIYLNIYAATHLTGVPEPLGSLQCNGALTSLHRILPAITQGYAVCDIVNGIGLGPAFLAHGIATFTVMAMFNELGASHIITPMLVMEISTIVLTTLRAEFFTPTMQLITQASFSLLFFLSRIVISPVVHFEIATTMNKHMGDCFPRWMFYVTLGFGAFFHCLNLFWFVKLVKKIRMKLSGDAPLEMKKLNEE